MSDDFTDALQRAVLPVREMATELGDPGAIPATKLGGVPWWPKGRSRPVCDDGHFMSFIMQFMLADVPGFETSSGCLVSFHYCQECSYNGNMSFGWNCLLGNTGYDISVFDNVASVETDDVGIVAEQVIEPNAVRLRDLNDAPNHLFGNPEEYGFQHCSGPKLGGWPTWVQEADEPTDGGDIRLGAQLDWKLCPRSVWASGGYAYIFVIQDGDELDAELAIQTT